jgi:hypothetical protein
VPDHADDAINCARGQVTLQSAFVALAENVPDCLCGALLFGRASTAVYCYGIRSERRLCEEVSLNLVYRWFCRSPETFQIYRTRAARYGGRYLACGDGAAGGLKSCGNSPCGVDFREAQPVLQTQFSPGSAALKHQFAWSHRSRLQAKERPLLPASMVPLVHLLAAGAWIGGLPPLFFYLSTAARQKQEEVPTLPTLHWFSFIGQWAVAIILVGGASTLAALVAAWNIKFSDLYLSDYGLALLVKLALLGIMLVIAGVNRFVLLPRLERGAGQLGLLRQMVLAECILGALVIAAGTTLSRLPPPIQDSSRAILQRQNQKLALKSLPGEVRLSSVNRTAL